MKAMEGSRRGTIQEIQVCRKFSTIESLVSKRHRMSLPNFEDDKTISFQRNTLLTSVITSDPGEKKRNKLFRHREHILKRLKRRLFLFQFLLSPLPTFSPPVLLSLFLLALRMTPKPVKVFKLPNFPASHSTHSVQTYYAELIQQLSKAICSAQNDSPALLARYPASIVSPGSFGLSSLFMSFISICAIMVCTAMQLFQINGLLHFAFFSPTPNC